MIEIKTEKRIDAGSCNVCGVNPYVDDRCPENVEVLCVGWNNATTQLRFCPKCFASFAAVVAGHQKRLDTLSRYPEYDRESIGAKLGAWMAKKVMGSVEQDLTIGREKLVQGMARVEASDQSMRVADENGNFPRCKPMIGSSGECENCGLAINQHGACPASLPEQRWSIDWSKADA